MEFTKEMKLEITHDKLVDLLMHAATREDIAATRKELKDDIFAFRNELKSDILSFRSELKDDISAIRKDINKISWFIIFSVLVPIFFHIFHI